MEVLELVLVLVASVLASALLSQATKRVSAPLIQIAIGAAIALFYGGGALSNFHIDEELFLVLLISPLLYNEAKNADRLMLWTNKKTIVSLAVGLVVAITLAVGFGMHWLYPSIPLAACFALGAALGPTDAVAVSSLSKTTALTRRQKGILSGESLINDASGLVAFQFAIAAAVTGAFSIADAGASFLLLFFGGIAVGLVLGVAMTAFVALIRSRGFDNTTFHVLLDVLLPFVAYLVGEAFGVSGILSVVACGIVFNMAPRDAGAEVSRMNITSASVWKVLAFALNGIVFTLLGLQLPGGIASAGVEGGGPWTMLAAIFAVSALLVLVRFLWVLFTEAMLSASSGVRRSLDRSVMKHALVLTFSGAKGAITLSIAFMIPSTVAGADTLVTVASGTILCTLLLANFAVPALAPAHAKTFTEEQQDELDFKAAVLRKTLRWLASEQDDGNRLAVQSVMEEYDRRLSKLKIAGADGYEGDEVNVALRVQALRWEEEKTVACLSDGSVSQGTAYKYLYRLHRAMSRMESRGDVGWAFARGYRRVRAWLSVSADVLSELLGIDALREASDGIARGVRSAADAVKSATAVAGAADVKTDGRGGDGAAEGARSLLTADGCEGATRADDAQGAGGEAEAVAEEPSGASDARRSADGYDGTEASTSMKPSPARKNGLSGLTGRFARIEIDDECVCDGSRSGVGKAKARALRAAEEKDEMRRLRGMCAEYALAQLETALYERRYPAEDISAVMLEYHRMMRTRAVEGLSPSMTTIIEMDDKTDKWRSAALRHEAELIDEAYDAGEISRALANSMKRSIYTMQLDVESAI